jgi:predicted MFS family arabinose efflux permease
MQQHIQILATLQTWPQIVTNWKFLLAAGAWAALATFPFGFFAGIVLATQFIGLYHCAPKKHMATAISMYYMCQQIGIALGISVCSSFLKQEFQAALQKMLVDVPGHKEASSPRVKHFDERKMPNIPRE